MRRPPPETPTHHSKPHFCGKIWSRKGTQADEAISAESARLSVILLTKLTERFANAGSWVKRWKLRGARKERGDFDNRVRKLAHSTDEGLDEAGIKLRVGTALEFRERLFGGTAFFVTAIAGDRVVRIRDGNNART